MDSRTQPQRNEPRLLLQFPGELYNNIISLLANSDIKNLRLTCKTVHDATPLRFDRVFLSTHPRDIEVFKAVAQHDRLRHGITEIIYDDARITDPPPPQSSDEDPYLSACESPPPEGVPAWYKQRYTEIVDTVKTWQSRDFQGHRHLARAAQVRDRLDVKRSWEEYRKIQRAQKHAVRTDADTEALLLGLPCFPRLQRIMLTPAAHGENLRPLYETPMIRALSHGFLYPVPRAWPACTEWTKWDGLAFAVEMEPWREEDVKNQWRGFRVVTRALASHFRNQSPEVPNTITEFVVDSNYLDTGLNCHIFTEQKEEDDSLVTNEEYDNLVTFLQQPNVRRLDLALHVGSELFSGRDFFHSDALRRAFAQAPALEHVSLYTNMKPEKLGLDAPPVAKLEYWVPLRNLFPIDVWSSLRHFGLVEFIVTQSDLLALLKSLPPTLESVELSFLYFVNPEGEGSYCELLTDVRNSAELGWRQRPAGERPRITIRVQTKPGRSRTRFTCVSREAESYVYGEGESPFNPGNDLVYMGHGRRYDAFDPDYMRPNLDNKKVGRGKRL